MCAIDAARISAACTTTDVSSGGFRTYFIADRATFWAVDPGFGADTLRCDGVSDHLRGKPRLFGVVLVAVNLPIFLGGFVQLFVARLCGDFGVAVVG